MTDNTITATEILKSKQKFSEYISENLPPSITSTISNYSTKSETELLIISELTQNFETFINAVNSDIFQNKEIHPDILWIVTNEKENIMNVIKFLNNDRKKGCNLFVFKAFLNEDKIDFKCLLKPELHIKREKNENTPAKLIQKEYWEKYIEICDSSEYPDMQISNALPQHFQYIGIRKKGVQIVQTLNTKDKYVASELFINNDKSIFNNLFEHKEEIEAEVGELDWQYLEGKKSSRIRKTLDYDISQESIRETAINEHLKLAQELTNVFSKYLK